MAKEGSAEATIRDIKRKTRRKYSTRRENPDCHRRATRRAEHRRAVPAGRIAESLYYSWSKEFMEAGKARISV